MSRKLLHLIVARNSKCCFLQATNRSLAVSTVKTNLARVYSTEAQPMESHEIPHPSFSSEKVYEPKIVQLVDSISGLTLREVADLNELLKSTLNIKDVAMVAASSPVTAAAEEVEEDEKVPEKTDFAIKVVSYNAADKIKVIKALKSVKPDLNLVQAKKFAENLPAVLLEDIQKEQCDELKKVLEDAGAKIEIY